MVNLLKRAEVYFPGHPSRIWEAEIILITTDKETFDNKINQTENKGSDIYTPTNEWRKDEIGKCFIVGFHIVPLQ